MPRGAGEVGRHVGWACWVLLRTLTVSSLILVLVGCGDDSPPSVAAPELGATLSDVDSALANRNYGRAEKALDQLAAEAVEAEQAGEISKTDADRIVEAASSLLARLPGDGGVDVPEEDSDSPAPETSPPTDSDEDEEKDEEEDKDKDKDKDEDEDEDEDEGDEGKGNGNGHGSENGPDDGHGN
jgi:hypothetical protein